MSRPAIKLPAPVDLAPWRIQSYGDAYWNTVTAAAREVTGANYDTETLTAALARFGYQRATINGVRGIARNGVMVRPDRGSIAWSKHWLWLARLKRRLEARGAAR